MKKVVILTGGELRHAFFRKAIALSHGITVLRTYCEGLEKSLGRLVEATEGDCSLRSQHLAARERSEKDFFGAFVALSPDRSNPVHVPKGEINDVRYVEAIESLHPDLLVTYGCSLIRDPLLSAFQGRFLNVHLGLSPYYRGSGTNFWPLVNGEPEYVGATFMHIDAGVDTGEIIHQTRARFFPGDSAHQIGNRLIADMTLTYAGIICSFDVLDPVPQIPVADDGRVYRRKDFSEEAVRKLYGLFENGLIERYLAEERERCARVRIVVNPKLTAEHHG